MRTRTRAASYGMAPLDDMPAAEWSAVVAAQMAIATVASKAVIANISRRRRRHRSGRTPQSRAIRRPAARGPSAPPQPPVSRTAQHVNLSKFAPSFRMRQIGHRLPLPIPTHTSVRHPTSPPESARPADARWPLTDAHF